MGEGQPAAAAPPGPARVVTRRMRLASPRTAMVLGALAVVLTALNVVLAELVHQLTFLGVGPGIPVFLIYAGVGMVIARHQPRNPVAWVLIGFVLLAMLSADAGYYAVYCYRLGHHGLPLAGVAAALVPLTVRIDLARVVHRALEPTHTSVWVSHPGVPSPRADVRSQ